MERYSTLIMTVRLGEFHLEDKLLKIVKNWVDFIVNPIFLFIFVAKKDMSKVLGVYRITYPKYGMSYVKNLIYHEDYETTYKLWNGKKQELETELAELNKKKHGDRMTEIKTELRTIKTKLSEMFGSEFFTDQSPIWLSQKAGGVMFLSPWQGGVIDIQLEKLD